MTQPVCRPCTFSHSPVHFLKKSCQLAVIMLEATSISLAILTAWVAPIEQCRNRPEYLDHPNSGPWTPGPCERMMLHTTTVSWELVKDGSVRPFDTKRATTKTAWKGDCVTTCDKHKCTDPHRSMSFSFSRPPLHDQIQRPYTDGPNEDCIAACLGCETPGCFGKTLPSNEDGSGQSIVGRLKDYSISMKFPCWRDLLEIARV